MTDLDFMTPGDEDKTPGKKFYIYRRRYRRMVSGSFRGGGGYAHTRFPIPEEGVYSSIQKKMYAILPSPTRIGWFRLSTLLTIFPIRRAVPPVTQQPKPPKDGTTGIRGFKTPPLPHNAEKSTFWVYAGEREGESFFSYFSFFFRAPSLLPAVNTRWQTEFRSPPPLDVYIYNIVNPLKK